MTTTDNRPRCTLAQLRARWGPVIMPPEVLRVDSTVTKEAMAGLEAWRVEKIEGKDVHLVQVNAGEEET